MARNSEKQYGQLNRLVLSKEREEYEKNHPKRPNLNTLGTVEEIQKWLPSIKEDMNFYLMKSQVICYSDDHIEECKQKVDHLSREYKAFVRKITQLTSGTLEAIPWTNRAYKRKCFDSEEQISVKKEFIPIRTPILDHEPKPQEQISVPVHCLPLMNEPLTFICVKPKPKLTNDKFSNTHNTNVSDKLLHNNTKPTCLDTNASNKQLHNTTKPYHLDTNASYKPLHNNTVSPCLDIKSLDYAQNSSVKSSEMDQPLIFQRGAQECSKSSEPFSSFSERRNIDKNGCDYKSGTGLVNYESSSDSES